MKQLIIIAIITVILPNILFGQVRISSNKMIQDSICQFGKKYIKPNRMDIHFPTINVSDKYKISEIHKAIPDSFNNISSPNKWFYNYYYGSDLIDYDPIGDSTFHPAGDLLQYKLKDTYFFDMNGDGLIDFIHYPKYYMVIMRYDQDIYELYIQQKNGSYSRLTFKGYIVEMEYNKDRTLNKVTTFQASCCDDNQATFYHYKFNVLVNELTLVNTEQILNCQFRE